jgi:hypothetical protein
VIGVRGQFRARELLPVASYERKRQGCRAKAL